VRFPLIVFEGPKVDLTNERMNGSMNTLNFLDANVWLALMWSRHVHSERATLWFEQVGEEHSFSAVSRSSQF
jgi:hypothetical protein